MALIIIMSTMMLTFKQRMKTMVDGASCSALVMNIKQTSLGNGHAIFFARDENTMKYLIH